MTAPKAGQRWTKGKRFILVHWIEAGRTERVGWSFYAESHGAYASQATGTHLLRLILDDGWTLDTPKPAPEGKQPDPRQFVHTDPRGGPIVYEPPNPQAAGETDGEIVAKWRTTPYTPDGHVAPMILPMVVLRSMLREIDRLTKERDDLAAWKESAMSVCPPLQEIGVALGVTLGSSIHDKILPGILAIKAELAALRDRVSIAKSDYQLLRRQNVEIRGIAMDQDLVIKDLRDRLSAPAQAGKRGAIPVCSRCGGPHPKTYCQAEGAISGPVTGEAESYMPGWKRLVLMVGPTGEGHAIEDAERINDGSDRPWPLFDRFRKYTINAALPKAPAGRLTVEEVTAAFHTNNVGFVLTVAGQASVENFSRRFTTSLNAALDAKASQ